MEKQSDENKAEQELQEWLKDAPGAEINLVEEWKRRGAKAQDILDELKSW